MKRRRKTRRLVKLIAVLVAVDVLLLAGIIALFALHKGPEELQRDSLAQLIGPEARNMDEAELDDARLQLLSDAIRMVTYNPMPEYEDGAINIYLSNAEENTCSVSAEIKLLTDGSVIAASGLIDPGYRVETLEISGEYSPGEYPCLMVLQAWSQGGTHLGQAGRNFMLLVK